MNKFWSYRYNKYLKQFQWYLSYYVVFVETYFVDIFKKYSHYILFDIVSIWCKLFLLWFFLIQFEFCIIKFIQCLSNILNLFSNGIVCIVWELCYLLRSIQLNIASTDVLLCSHFIDQFFKCNVNYKLPILTSVFQVISSKKNSIPRWQEYLFPHFLVTTSV